MAHSMGEVGKRTHSKANLSSNFDELGFNDKSMIGSRKFHACAFRNADQGLPSSSDDSEPSIPSKGHQKIAETDNDQMFTCLYEGCGKQFKRKIRLKAHQHIHYGTQPFRCTFPGCGKGFSEK